MSNLEEIGRKLAAALEPVEFRLAGSDEIYMIGSEIGTQLGLPGVS